MHSANALVLSPSARSAITASDPRHSAEAGEAAQVSGRIAAPTPKQGSSSVLSPPRLDAAAAPISRLASRLALPLLPLSPCRRAPPPTRSPHAGSRRWQKTVWHNATHALHARARSPPSRASRTAPTRQCYARKRVSDRVHRVRPHGGCAYAIASCRVCSRDESNERSEGESRPPRYTPRSAPFAPPPPCSPSPSAASAASAPELGAGWCSSAARPSRPWGCHDQCHQPGLKSPTKGAPVPAS